MSLAMDGSDKVAVRELRVRDTRPWMAGPEFPAPVSFAMDGNDKVAERELRDPERRQMDCRAEWPRRSLKKAFNQDQW